MKGRPKLIASALPVSRYGPLLFTRILLSDTLTTIANITEFNFVAEKISNRDVITALAQGTSFDTQELPDNKIDSLFERLSKELTRLREVNLPASAPEEWANRGARVSENPFAFIKRVYAPWIGTIQRADIGRLDRPLYLAFATWIKRNNNQKDACYKELHFSDRSLELTTELQEKKIKEPMDAFRRIPEELRHDHKAVTDAFRLYSAAKRRIKPRPKPASLNPL